MGVNADSHSEEDKVCKSWKSRAVWRLVSALVHIWLRLSQHNLAMPWSKGHHVYLTFFFLSSSLLGYGVMPGAPCFKAWPDYAVIGEVIYEPVHWQAFKELYFFTIYKLCPPQSGRLHLLMYFFLCWTNCLFRVNLGKGQLWKKQEPERLPCLEKFICNIWHPWPLYKHSQ